MEMDVKLEQFLDDLRSKTFGEWVINSFNDLVREGASKEKLLDLIKQDVSEDTSTQVKTLLERDSSDELVGIGGWMILPLIGLFLAPLMAAKVLLVDISPMFEPGVWEALTVPGGAGYHPAWAAVGYATFAANVILIVGSLALVYGLFRKLALFPKGMVAFYLYIFATSVAEFVVMKFVMADAFPGMLNELEGDLTMGIVRSLVGVLVWIPYFLTSERVRNTFVN